MKEIGNSYLKQYGNLQLTGAIPGNPVSPNDGGFNWDSIAEELMTAITVV